MIDRHPCRGGAAGRRGSTGIRASRAHRTTPVLMVSGSPCCWGGRRPAVRELGMDAQRRLDVHQQSAGTPAQPAEDQPSRGRSPVTRQREPPRRAGDAGSVGAPERREALQGVARGRVAVVCRSSPDGLSGHRPVIGVLGAAPGCRHGLGCSLRGAVLTGGRRYGCTLLGHVFPSRSLLSGRGCPTPHGGGRSAGDTTGAPAPRRPGRHAAESAAGRSASRPASAASSASRATRPGRSRPGERGEPGRTGPTVGLPGAADGRLRPGACVPVRVTAAPEEPAPWPTGERPPVRRRPRLDLPRGVAQLGSAPALGAGGRRFKSCHPDRPRPPDRHSSGCL